MKGKHHIMALNLEPVWYYDDPPIHPQERDEFFEIVDNQLWEMIKENRYYSTRSVTPYFYEGFSDTLHGKGRIEYNNEPEEPEEEYLIFHSDIGENRIAYALELTADERRNYLDNDFEYTDEDDMILFYLINMDENTGLILTYDDFLNYLSLVLSTAGVDDLDQAVLWDENAQEWIIDTNSQWFDLNMESENNTDLILTQANGLYYFFWRKGMLTDDDMWIKEWLMVLFHQYGKLISKLNFSGGLFCNNIGRMKSFIGDMRGDRLFYFKDVKTLFTEKDQTIRSTIIDQIKAGEIGNP